MENDQFNRTARDLSAALANTLDRYHVPKADRMQIATIALVETIGDCIGPLGTVEYLRGVADHLEAQYLS